VAGAAVWGWEVTFLGLHTVRETQDLIKSKDIVIAKMSDVRKAMGFSPDDTWDDHFNRFLRRWSDAKFLANGEISATSVGSPGVSENVLTTELAYIKLTHALDSSQSFDRVAPKVESGFQVGCLQDLFTRLNDELRLTTGQTIDIDTRLLQTDAIDVDQKVATSDVDLNVFKGADKTVKALGDPFNPNSNTMLFIGIGAGVLGLGVIGLYASQFMPRRRY